MPFCSMGGIELVRLKLTKIETARAREMETLAILGENYGRLAFPLQRDIIEWADGVTTHKVT